LGAKHEEEEKASAARAALISPSRTDIVSISVVVSEMKYGRELKHLFATSNDPRNLLGRFLSSSVEPESYKYEQFYDVTWHVLNFDHNVHRIIALGI